MNNDTICDNCDNIVNPETGWSGNYMDENFSFCADCISDD
jgi:hypothetical protein